jgi:SpoIID/LytB domain protein
LRRGRNALLAFVAAAAMLVPLGASVASAPAAAAWPTPNVSFYGHGYGHGRGMGQWGAYGYAIAGVSDLGILDHFYGGTTDSVEVVARSVTVRLMGQEGTDLLVTSSTGLHVGGVDVGPGGAARVTFSGGQYLVSVSSSCFAAPGPPVAVSDPTVWPNNLYPGNDVAQMLTICNSGTAYRGQLTLVNSAGQHTVNTVLMEEYLWGVVPRESPASWANAPGGINALRAQAVAARSYAWAENRYSYARTCDTTSCQVYGGAGRNGELLEDSRTNAAVNDTKDHVRRFGDGSMARTEFSSSTGGWTAGGTFPVVPDDGDTSSPYHNWSVDIPADSVEAAWGLGTLTEITVLTRNGYGAEGGRVLSVRLSGTAGTVTTTGNDVAARLGLRSNWFSVGQPPGEAWYLRTTPSTGPPDLIFNYGLPGDIPLACDWFGIGRATPGVVRNGTWYLSASPTGASVDAIFRYGDPGDTPLCGDWDGNGTETPGVWRAGTFYFSNVNGPVVASYSVRFGDPTDRPIVGHWTGGPFDLIGVVRNARFYLSFDNISPAASQEFVFGNPGDIPLAGDWDGDGRETVGLRRSNTFYLSDIPASAVVSRQFIYGDPADTPLAARFVPGSPTGIGVARAQ